LSSGLLGNAYHHSDIGGYTSLFGNVRTPELLMRWSEMAAFTPVMRSHEGNRPGENLQLDQDPEVLAHFARMTQLYCGLVPYLRHVSAEAAATGLPVQRPLFLHYPADAESYTIQDQYLYGPDMLVAPVWQAGQHSRPVYLPAGVDWEQLWDGEGVEGGQWIEAAAPIGRPAVYFDPESRFAALFRQLRAL
jgi:alpha-glucosidase